MVYHKQKDCVNHSLPNENSYGIDLAMESDHISYAFADINWSLYVKLTNGPFKFFNTIDDLNNM